MYHIHNFSVSFVSVFFNTLIFYKQPESGLKSCLNFLRFLSSKLLKIPWILVNLTRKQWKKSIINTIFKQLVISDPQKLLHFSRAWALHWLLINWLLVKKSVRYECLSQKGEPYLHCWVVKIWLLRKLLFINTLIVL